MNRKTLIGIIILGTAVSGMGAVIVASTIRKNKVRKGLDAKLSKGGSGGSGKTYKNNPDELNINDVKARSISRALAGHLDDYYINEDKVLAILKNGIKSEVDLDLVKTTYRDDKIAGRPLIADLTKAFDRQDEKAQLERFYENLT